MSCLLQKGRPDDRQGRQMSAFFDLSTLEKNREEAQRVKKQLQQAKNIDWRKYKEEKKLMKLKRSWLYSSDD